MNDLASVAEPTAPQAAQERPAPSSERAVPSSWQRQRADRLIEAGLLPCVQAVIALTGAVRAADVRTAATRALARDPVLSATGEESRTNGAQSPSGVATAWAECDARDVPVSLHDAVRTRTCRDERRAVSSSRPVDLVRTRLLRWTANRWDLIVTVSARAGDASTLNLLCAEMLDEWGAGRPVASGPPTSAGALSCAAVVEWERALAEEENEEGELFWQLQDKGATEEAAPLVEGHRTSSPPYDSGFAFAEPGPALEAMWRAARLRDSATPALLLACWQVLCWRLLGIISPVGVTIPARRYPELEHVAGPLDRTVPLGATLRRSGTIQDRVRRVDQWWRGAVECQECYHPGAAGFGVGHVFGLGFVHTAWQAQARRPDLDARLIAPQFDSAGARLTLICCEIDGAGLLGVQCDLRTVAPDGARRLASSLVALVTDAVRRPFASLDDLSVLTAEERAQIVTAWNDTAVAWPSDAGATVVARFERQVSRAPEAIAVRTEEDHWTYARLDAVSNQLAHRLQRGGVGAEVRVGVWLPRSPRLVASLLAVMKAGGVYVPLDPSYPSARLVQQAVNAGVRVVLTDTDGATHVPASVQHVEVLDGPGASWNTESADPVRVTVDPAQLAYIIYTSGSTGRPKGVMIASGSQQNHLSWVCETFEVSPDDRVLQTVAVGFDPSLLECLVPLLAGGALVIPPADGPRDPAYLCRAIQQHGISIMQAVPSLLASLVDEPSFPRSLSLRLLIVGGEALPGALVSRVRASSWPGRLANLYGPTETTVDATWQVCTEADMVRRVTAIGRPLANTQTYVVGADWQPVPVGMVGELMIGGVQVARGYWGEPALTALRFVPDAFGNTPGARVYRTGDLARYRADGVVAYVGRADHQVKVRGHRIELGEIEAVLRGHSDVRDAAVLLREDSPGAARLVAYVLPEPGAASASGETLQRYLRLHVPDVMVPAAVVSLPALPLLPNGKLDRNQLPSPETTRLEACQVAPRTQAEEMIMAAWGDVLGLDRVGADDNFLEIGGHSLNAVQVLVRLREAFGREIELNTLFEFPTPATLALALLAEPGDAGAEPALERVAREEALPVSFGQERLWIVDQITGTRAYHVPLAVRVAGRLEAWPLRAAVRGLAERHEVLRTTFDEVEGRPVQRVGPVAPVPVAWIDIGAVADTARPRLQMRARRQLDTAPFDLRTGPLWRVAVVHLSSDEHIINCTLHHIVADGWSIGILLRDVAALYAAALTGESPRVPPLAVQYADYAVWQRRTLSGGRLAAQLEYWRTHLADVTPLMLPTDRPRPKVSSGRGGLVTRRWPDALAADAQRYGRTHGATAFMVMLAAWQVLLARYAGQRDVAVGVPVAQRPRPELEGLIGFFLNTIVVRSTIAKGATWRTLVAHVRERALGAYAHQLVPFEQVIAGLQPERDLARTPLFQVMFVLHNYPTPTVQLEALRFDALESGSAGAKFDLELTVNSREGELTCQLQYAVELFEPATVERMLAHLETLHAAALASPDVPLEELSFLTAAERSALVSAWQPDAVWVGEPTRIEQRIAAAATGAAERLAVVSDEERYQYGELDSRSNRLARHLRRRGVGRNDLVPLLVDRHAAALVGFLGILKAGAGYVPLAPDGPPERLRVQVRDLGSRVILCDEKWASLAAETGLEIIALGREAGWEEESSEPVPTVGGGDDIAYALYTSGSTGTPKAVVVPHGALVNYTRWIVERLEGAARGQWTYGVVSSLQADLANTSIYAALTTGGTIRLMSHEVATDPIRFAEVMAGPRVDVLKIVPAHLQVLLAGANASAALPRHWIVLGGEQLGWELATMLHAHGVRVLNHYGPTEATVGCVSFEVHSPSLGARASASVPIGSPIANTRVYVRDAAGGIVPAGVTGELYIGGAGLARGYWGQPGLTADRFVPDPSGPAGSRLYRTGDLVRSDAAGTLEYLGRRDTQVKVRGHRVELGEIEVALRRRPGVRDAAVLLREDSPGDRRLVAYVVAAEPDEPPLGEILQRQLGASLPGFMVPAVVVVLPSLPLSPNGKIDRRRLPAPSGDRPDLAAPYAAPETGMQERIARLWSEILDVERVGIHDNFFALGGDSIAAIQFSNRARTEGLSATPVFVFQHQTIAELAAHFDAQEPDGPGEAPVSDAAITPDQLAFLSSRVQLDF